MNQYNFPTTILSGRGALVEFAERLEQGPSRRPLIITDKGLVACGLLDRLTGLLATHGMKFSVFSGIHANPVEADVENGAAVYRDNGCDCIIGFGGGSPMDAAKAVRIMAVHPPPFDQYDEACGGDRRITQPMPCMYAIPTTAGTGSEVGRSAVIILERTGKKAIFFHPRLMPDMAVLEPALTTGLPPDITAATGMDAFVHCLEAYFAPGLHPMADGIALSGMELVLDRLPEAVADGENLAARERMLIAASMGATAFQKGLGMIHSLAHPLSSRHGMHHGLANALLLPAAVSFLENSDLDDHQEARISRVRRLFINRGLDAGSLSASCGRLAGSLGIQPGLAGRGISEDDLETLSSEAYEDPCHQTNMISVNRKDLLSVYRAAL